MEEKQEHTAEKTGGIKKEILSWLQIIVSCIIILTLIVAFIGRPVIVNGKSMSPTLSSNDRLITLNVYGALNRGDIVAIKRTDGEPLIKRIIGLPGETVDIDYNNNKVIINGNPLSETYIPEAMIEPSFKMMNFPLTLQKDCYFVMGDNRNHSSDSRDVNIGVINKSDIFGRAWLRFMPFGSFGLL